MKYHLLIIILFICTNSNSQSIPSYWLHSGENSKYYKTIGENIESISVNVKLKGTDSPPKIRKYLFSDETFITEEYYRDGELKEIHRVRVDENQNIISRSSSVKTTYGTWRKFFKTYDYIGEKLFCQKRYNQDSTLTELTYWEYDSLGSPVKLSFLNSKGKMTSYSTATYNYKKGNYKLRSYDKDNKLVLEELNSFIYEGNGLLYNKYGDIQEIRNDLKGYSQNFVYEYDENGNWIKRIKVNQKGKKREIVTRTIAYNK